MIMVGFQCRALEQSGLQETRRKESWLLNVDGCLKRTRVVDGLLLNIFVAHDSYLEWIVHNYYYDECSFSCISLLLLHMCAFVCEWELGDCLSGHCTWAWNETPIGLTVPNGSTKAPFGHDAVCAEKKLFLYSRLVVAYIFFAMNIIQSNSLIWQTSSSDEHNRPMLWTTTALNRYCWRFWLYIAHFELRVYLM